MQLHLSHLCSIPVSQVVVSTVASIKRLFRNKLLSQKVSHLSYLYSYKAHFYFIIYTCLCSAASSCSGLYLFANRANSCGQWQFFVVSFGAWLPFSGWCAWHGLFYYTTILLMWAVYNLTCVRSIVYNIDGWTLITDMVFNSRLVAPIRGTHMHAVVCMYVLGC